MSEKQLEHLLKKSVPYLPSFNGRHVNYKTYYKGRSFLNVDIGFKKGTLIPLKELSSKNNYALGSSNQGIITQLESNRGDFVLDVFQLNKVDPEIIWKLISNAYKKRYLVKGRILNVVNGGFSVGLSGIVAFLPNSHLVRGKSPTHKHWLERTKPFIGSILSFKVLKMNPARRNIIVSRTLAVKQKKRDNS
jgi:small subunit ribosomal protein S1